MSADVPPPGASMALLVEELTVVVAAVVVTAAEAFLRGIIYIFEDLGPDLDIGRVCFWNWLRTIGCFQ